MTGSEMEFESLFLQVLVVFDWKGKTGAEDGDGVKAFSLALYRRL